jgi:hypothetical protein
MINDLGLALVEFEMSFMDFRNSARHHMSKVGAGELRKTRVTTQNLDLT